MLSWSLGKEISKEGSNVSFVIMAIESLFAFSGYRASGEIELFGIQSMYIPAKR